MLQKKNLDAKGFPREVLGVFVPLIISENNQISVKKNLRKKSFWRHQSYDI